VTQVNRLRFWLIGLALLLVALYLLRGILMPFAAGMIIAYFLDPLADRLERLGASRLAATGLITIGFFIALVLLLVLILPLAQGQVGSFAGKVPGYVERLVTWAQPALRHAQRYLSPQDLERLRSALGDSAGTAMGWIGELLTGLLAGGAAVINALSLIFITPVVTFYMLRDWDRMVAKVDGWLPRAHVATIRAQAVEINRTLAGFLRGQASVCLLLAAYYGIGLTVVGLDVGLVLGLGVGLVAFVPYVGAISGFALGIVLALAQSHDWSLPGLVTLVFLGGQVLEGNFLTPKLVGDKVGLHPVWIIFALLAAGSLFGFLGILLAVPAAAVIGVLARFALARYLSSPLYDHRNGEASP
jgi:predicted PurR-regulated permease PerM